MARPRKNNADWFKHDKDMRNNRKVKALRNLFGIEGYAVWCMLLEALAEADNFRLEWDALDRELWAADFGLTSDRLGEIIDFMQRLGLVDIEDDMLFSPSVEERMADLMEQRVTIRGRVARNNSEKESFNAKNPVKTPEKESFNAKNPVKTPEKESFNAKNPVKTPEKESFNALKPHRIDKDKDNIISLSISPSSLPREDAQADACEREKFFSVFFFRNISDPDAEVQRFVDHYEARDWVPNGQQRAVSPSGRLALSRTWESKHQQGRFSEACTPCLSWLHLAYDKAVKAEGQQVATQMLREVKNIQHLQPDKAAYVITCSPQTREVIERNNPGRISGVELIYYKTNGS